MILEQDETDWEILRLLQNDGRMTNAELAERIHRSESACHGRVRRLESDGAIQGYVAVLNQSALGRSENIFVEITLTTQSEEQLDAFEAAVSTCPGVMSCYFMTGDSDYLLHVVVADTAHYEQLYRTICRVSLAWREFAPALRCELSASEPPTTQIWTTTAK